MTRLLPDANPLACSLYELERMIALSPTYQSIVGTSDWRAARDKICFIEDDTDPGDFPRPVCVVSLDSLEYHQVAGGMGNYLRPSGSLWLYLAIDIPSAYLLTGGSHAIDQMPNRKNQLQYITNIFGDFIQDLASASGTDQTADTDVTDSNLGAPKILLRDMARTPEALWASLGQFWYLVLSVHWGDS